MAEAENAYKPNPLPPNPQKFRHASCMDDNIGAKSELRYTDFIGQGWNQNHADDSAASCSSKYFAGHSSGSNLAVVQLHKPGRKSTVPCAKYHNAKGKVTVSRWSPHNPGLLASGDENGNVFLGYFEDSMFDDATGLLKDHVMEPMMEIETNFAKKITSLEWHPVIKNLIAIAGAEGQGTFKVKFFDTDSGTEVAPAIETEKQAVSITWNWDCQHVAWIDKNKGHTCSIYNLKALGGPQLVGEIKTDLMRTSCVFINDAVDIEDHNSRCNKYITIIGSDGAKNATTMNTYTLDGKQVGKTKFEGTGKVYHSWDSGRNLMWMFIKGSGTMKGMNWVAKKAIFKVCCGYAEHGKRIKGGAFVPQAGLQVTEYCIAELMALEGPRNTGEIWPFRFIVPRLKKGEFEEVLYPEIVAMNQEMDANAWKEAESQPKGPKMASCDPMKGEDVVFVKKATYSELAAMVEEYEAFILGAVTDGKLDKNSIPAGLQAKLEADA